MHTLILDICDSDRFLIVEDMVYNGDSASMVISESGIFLISRNKKLLELNKNITGYSIKVYDKKSIESEILFILIFNMIEANNNKYDIYHIFYNEIVSSLKWANSIL